MKITDVNSIPLRFGGDSDSDYDESDDSSSSSTSDNPPEGTEVGGDGEPISPGESNPYPNGG